MITIAIESRFMPPDMRCLHTAQRCACFSLRRGRVYGFGIELMIACHADHIGSLLRPPELILAREEAAAGRVSRAQFKVIEDRAVEDAIRLQESVGLPVITDGEQ